MVKLIFFYSFCTCLEHILPYFSKLHPVQKHDVALAKDYEFSQLSQLKLVWLGGSMVMV